MGAEQSASLVCTQTVEPEAPLKLHNAKQFFQLDFDKMTRPRTGPVTEALLYLILNGPKKSPEEMRNSWSKLKEQCSSGYENDEPEVGESSDDGQGQKVDMISIKQEAVDDYSYSSGNQHGDDKSGFEQITGAWRPAKAGISSRL